VSADSPLIDLRGVGARIGAATILRNVDLAVAPGEGVGLFGGNGAGKTTLLRIIATLIRPAAGSGKVLGADLASAERFDVRRRIGLIGHVPGLYPELTLQENLSYAARLIGEPSGSVEAALDAVGLADAAGRRAEACSHGMQRRAEFAREIMRRPSLLLLDEPHTALDPDAVELVGHLVAGVTDSGGAAVVVSHDRARVATMVDRTAELRSGARGCR
jgi:heme ABC exporter ATP-binding subunit CcmA